MQKIELPDTLFWDVNPNLIDCHKNKRLIIERVFCLGDIQHLKIIINFYGMDTIKKEILDAGNLDKKTLNWISETFNIPQHLFRCYTKQQLS